MRVLDTGTGQFTEIDPRTTRYAILSHTWEKTEQSYQELLTLSNRYRRHWWRVAHRVAVGKNKRATRHPGQNDFSIASRVPSSSPSDSLPNSISPDDPLSPIWKDAGLSPKIREACKVARNGRYRYIWIDSCCIDKTSSSELSESINSMYQWYTLADVCYTFLADVSAEEDRVARDAQFQDSLWFTRGWTLQELIAPMDVVFLSKDWKMIGTKRTQTDLVSKITNISSDALLHKNPLDGFSVAQRLSWAAKRKTTRGEDRAYSLLGIFNINMPTLYGEGESAAFRRLQEEIMRRTPDRSLFVWTEIPDRFSIPERFSRGVYHRLDDIHTYATPAGACFQKLPGLDHPSLLAPSLDLFLSCSGIQALSHDETTRRLQFHSELLPTLDHSTTPTPYGIRLQLLVASISSAGYLSPECVDEPSMEVPFSQWYLVILECEHKDFPSGNLLARICYIRSSESNMESLYSGRIRIFAPPSISPTLSSDILILTPGPGPMTRLIMPPVSSKMLHIPHPNRDIIARWKPHRTIALDLLKESRKSLSQQGYTVTIHPPDQAHPNTHLVVLHHETRTVTIDYHHTLQSDQIEDQQENSAQVQKLTMVAHIMASALTPYQPTASATGNHPTRVHQVDDLGGARQVSWDDSLPWSRELPFVNVELNIPGPGGLASRISGRLGLNLATKNQYLARIELSEVLTFSS